MSRLDEIRRNILAAIDDADDELGPEEFQSLVIAIQTELQERTTDEQ